jgi:hypothetical protein
LDSIVIAVFQRQVKWECQHPCVECAWLPLFRLVPIHSDDLKR